MEIETSRAIPFRHVNHHYHARNETKLIENKRTKIMMAMIQTVTYHRQQVVVLLRTTQDECTAGSWPITNVLSGTTFTHHDLEEIPYS